MSDFSNNDDFIDSRDVISRIEELQDKLGVPDEMSEAELEAADSEDLAELEALLELQEEAEGYSEDWSSGATLIRDTYFEDYAQELAEDIGATVNITDWPMYCIDWERAARELKMDYTSVEFDGVTYWVR